MLQKLYQIAEHWKATETRTKREKIFFFFLDF